MLKIIKEVKSKMSRLDPKKGAEYLRSEGVLDCGKHCEIHSSVNIGSEPYLIKMGDRVKITAGVKFFNHDGGMWVIRNLEINPKADKMDTIIIGDNVFIGQNTLIMPGVEIGSNVVVGAGSIVTKDIPDNAVAVGSPATVKSDIQSYYEKNKDRIEDTKNMDFNSKKEFYLKKFGIK